MLLLLPLLLLLLLQPVTLLLLTTNASTISVTAVSTANDKKSLCLAAGWHQKHEIRSFILCDHLVWNIFLTSAPEIISKRNALFQNKHKTCLKIKMTNMLQIYCKYVYIRKTHKRCNWLVITVCVCVSWTALLFMSLWGLDTTTVLNTWFTVELTSIHRTRWV